MPVAWRLASAGLLVGLAAVQPAAAQPADREVRAAEEAGGRLIRRRDVGGWRIVYFSEGDGGLQVRMTRRGAGYSLEYHVSYWRGNGGPVRGAAFRDRDCRSGEAGSIQDPAGAWNAEVVRARFGEYFDECETPAARAAAMLAGFDRAFAVMAAWAGEAADATAAEAEAIANHGR